MGTSSALCPISSLFSKILLINILKSIGDNGHPYRNPLSSRICLEYLTCDRPPIRTLILRLLYKVLINVSALLLIPKRCNFVKGASYGTILYAFMKSMNVTNVLYPVNFRRRNISIIKAACDTHSSSRPNPACSETNDFFRSAAIWILSPRAMEMILKVVVMKDMPL